jgi:hypothetical protein
VSLVASANILIALATSETASVAAEPTEDGCFGWEVAANEADPLDNGCWPVAARPFGKRQSLASPRQFVRRDCSYLTLACSQVFSLISSSCVRPFA